VVETQDPIQYRIRGDSPFGKMYGVVEVYWRQKILPDIRIYQVDRVTREIQRLKISKSQQIHQPIQNYSQYVIAHLYVPKSPFNIFLFISLILSIHSSTRSYPNPHRFYHLLYLILNLVHPALFVFYLELKKDKHYYAPSRSVLRPPNLCAYDDFWVWFFQLSSVFYGFSYLVFNLLNARNDYNFCIVLYLLFGLSVDVANLASVLLGCIWVYMGKKKKLNFL
jgi:hypothetical protein